MGEDLPLHLLTPRSCRMARAGLGILQKELAKSAGVHVRTIKVLETGQARPQPKTATGILKAFVDRGVAFGLDGAVRIDGVGSRSSAAPGSFRPPQLRSAREFDAARGQGAG